LLLFSLAPIFFSEKAYYMIFEIPRKRPNEQRECDWSNLQTSIFDYGSCDKQGMKKPYSKLSHKKNK